MRVLNFCYLCQVWFFFLFVCVYSFCFVVVWLVGCGWFCLCDLIIEYLALERLPWLYQLCFIFKYYVFEKVRWEVVWAYENKRWVTQKTLFSIWLSDFILGLFCGALWKGWICTPLKRSAVYRYCLFVFLFCLCFDYHCFTSFGWAVYLVIANMGAVLLAFRLSCPLFCGYVRVLTFCYWVC